MFCHLYYVKNYASIIDTGLIYYMLGAEAPPLNKGLKSFTRIKVHALATIYWEIFDNESLMRINNHFRGYIASSYH